MAKVYQRGETPVFSLITRNPTTGAKANPDTSIKITVQNPAGTHVVDTAAMTPGDTGEYSYSAYTLPADGILGSYKVEVVVVNNGNTSIAGGSFEAVERTT